MVGGEDLEEEPLVRLGHRRLAGALMRELVRVEQVHAHLLHLELERGHLVDHLPIDRLLRLQPHHELIRSALLERAHDARHAMELDAHLRLAVRERLARLEHEWHAVPPGSVHVQHRRRERLGGRLLIRDRRVLEVARVLAAAHVLARDGVVEL